jgi:GntR family transcriptional regulator
MTTTILSGAGVSRYLRLYRVLSQALAEGRFGPGQPLPSEPRLMRDYRISRSTVRRALARLEAEGLIERRRGSGTFARGDGAAPARSRDLSSILEGPPGSPVGLTRRTIALRHIPSPQFLPGLQPEFGATTLLVRQIHYVEREPIALESAYLPQGIGGGLTRHHLAGKGPILTVLAGLGHRSSSLEREFAAIEADPVAADSLEVAVGAPLLNVSTLARDQRRRLVAYISAFYRPDRYEAHATVEVAHPRRDRAGQPP